MKEASQAQPQLQAIAVIKKETPRIISRSAEREEGYAPSTSRAFEKARPKLFVISTVLTLLSAS